MKLQRLLLRLLDRLIDRSPVIVPGMFHKAFLFVLGNLLIYKVTQWMYRNKLKRIREIKSILVVVDLNLGDAIIVQPTAIVLRRYFPNARIDYACNSTGGELMEGMNEADNVFRLYLNNGLPGEEQINGIRKTLNTISYDLILNFCPFLSKRIMGNKKSQLQIYVPLSGQVIRLWLFDREKRHISFLINSFMNDFLSSRNLLRENEKPGCLNNKSLQSFKGNTIYLSASDVKEAARFLDEHGLLNKRGIVVFHPDTPSIYTLIPVDLQVSILRSVLESEYTSAVLLGIGRSFSGIEDKIISGLPEELRPKIVIIPDMPIRVYAALIDASDMFVSGDTGPVHIAAARRELSDRPHNGMLRNRTAIVTLYGATDPKMYGYDSSKPYYQPSNQDAPSKVFVGSAPCRNVSCIDKLMKSCREIRCFNGLDADIIALYITTCLSGVNTLESKERNIRGQL